MIIGLIGFMGSGKGTVGDYLKGLGFYSDSFARPLKDCVSIIFNWDRSLLEGDNKESREWRETPDPYWSRVFVKPFTPRMALQQFGTEACREGLNLNIWCESLGSRIRGYDDVVITDVRFINEVEYVKSIGGLIVRVKRGDDPYWFEELSDLTWSNVRSNFMNQFNIHLLRSNFMNQFNIHSSEWDWVGSEVDCVIENSGTLTDLYEKVNDLLNKK